MDGILASKRGEGEVGQPAERCHQWCVRLLVPTDMSLTNYLIPALETIWVDLVLKNPLQVEAELTGLTAVVKEAGKTDTTEPREGFVEVEKIDKISLAPGEQRTVSTFCCPIFLTLFSIAR